MGFIAAADPASHVTRAFMNASDFTYAMEKLGYIPLRPDGTPFVVNFLENEGGYLLDGAPLNVWFQGVWYQGQPEVAAQYWGQNGVPTPTGSVMQLPVVAMPTEIAATYQAFKAAQSPLGSNTLMIVAAVGIGAFLLFGAGGGRKSKGAGAGDSLSDLNK